MYSAYPEAESSGRVYLTITERAHEGIEGGQLRITLDSDEGVALALTASLDLESGGRLFAGEEVVGLAGELLAPETAEGDPIPHAIDSLRLTLAGETFELFATSAEMTLSARGQFGVRCELVEEGASVPQADFEAPFCAAAADELDLDRWISAGRAPGFD